MSLTLITIIFYTIFGLANNVETKSESKVQVKSYKVGNDDFKILYKDGIGASPQCFENQGCMAYNPDIISVLKKIDIQQGNGGANPGALACHKISGVKVIIGTNQANGNQQSFCLFPDKSMLSTQSVSLLRK